MMRVLVRRRRSQEPSLARIARAWARVVRAKAYLRRLRRKQLGGPMTGRPPWRCT
jgi:hypothetical protein